MLLNRMATRGLFAITVLAMACAPVWAQMDYRKRAPPSWMTPADLETAKHLRHLCMFVDSRNEEPGDGSEHRYLAVTNVLKAAGVQDYRAPEEKERLQAMWARFEDLLVCNNVQFDVENGSILKFAAGTGFDAFFYFAVSSGLGINRVDPSDNRTLLDYVQFYAAKNKGNALEAKWRQYFRYLREAGGKHRSELP